MRRAFIIHGWQGTSKQGWYPWLGKELKKNGFEVNIPDMPNTEDPDPGLWLATLEALVGRPDNDTFLIGHSAGANTIMKYLERGHKVGGIVLVAPWPSLIPEKRKYGKEMGARWLDKEYDWKTVAGNAGSIVAIFGTGDPYVDIDDAEMFREKLNAGVIIEKGKRHISEYHGVMELPSALDAVLEQAGLR